jgi:hypothetical protein
VDGLLDQLTDRRSWSGTEEQIDYAVAQIQLLMVAIKSMPECEVNVPQVYPESFYADALALTLLTGSALSRSVNASAFVNHYVQITPIAQSNAYQIGAFLREGAYTLSVLGSTSNARGIITVGCSTGTVTGTMDFYSSAVVANVIKTVTIQITEPGQTLLSFHADTKNASSSNYDMALEAIWAERTGD